MVLLTEIIFNLNTMFSLKNLSSLLIKVSLSSFAGNTEIPGANTITPQTPEKSAPVSPEKMELEKNLDTANSSLKYLKKNVSVVKGQIQSLQSDPSEDKNDPEYKQFLDDRMKKVLVLEQQIQSYSDIKSQSEDGLSKLRGELSNLSTEIGRESFRRGIELNDGKVQKLKISANEMQSLNNEKFLSVPEKQRLQYITKNNIDSSRIVSGDIKDLEFNFDFNGKRNDELYMYTTAGQVLPNEVRKISSGGKTFERIGISGEFYSGKERFIIDTGTKAHIEELGDAKALDGMEKEIGEKYKNYIKENPKFADEQYKPAIIETFRKGLGNKELSIILNESYSDISKLDIEDAKKLLVVTRYLDNSGFLGSYLDAGELIKNLEEIVGVIEKYGKRLNYSINEKGEIKFKLGANGAPEGLEVEPSLEKFVNIALSQLGTTEGSGAADKYLNGRSARNIPWCAGFINWCLYQSGYKGTGSDCSKSFIDSTGYGHVGIKLGNKVLGGNQGNKVSLMNITKPIVGYSIPTEKGLEIHKPAGDPNKIPDGAIVVFDRDAKRDRNFA